MVGPFPPPVFGSAVVTAALRDALLRVGYKVQEINSSGVQLAQDGLFARAGRRLWVTFILAAGLIRQGPRISIYISYAGGGGQIGDLLNICLARLFRCPVTLHHHSFAYIRTPHALTRFVFAVAGIRARHIFLCGTMRRQAMRHYPSIRRGYILSNAALVDLPNGTSSALGPLRKIGFFSNIALTKGIDRFVELAKRLHERRLPVALEAAGPYRDKVSRQLIEATVADGWVTYHGALAGDAKQRFFERIDLLVLPSRYPHEAEPLVILESFAMSVPVIASDRGCIAELISGAQGLLLDAEAGDLDLAVRQIEEWILLPDRFIEARHAAALRAAHLRDSSLETLTTIMKHMAFSS
jgi:glycosyltransferase involved in cell wall biosynthesis